MEPNPANPFHELCFSLSPDGAHVDETAEAYKACENEQQVAVEMRFRPMNAR
ncbi:hypothetical protein ACI7RC_23300 [Brevibacillus sp. B_LB10_24]|uniref:hypothetical protein n=1 Tax=Brevibacillus sp. B_LB10_24 TaxID=3380645 RepID=UPI0038B882F4